MRKRSVRSHNNVHEILAFRLVQAIACARCKPQEERALHRALLFNMAAVTSCPASAFLIMAFNFVTSLSTCASVNMA